MENKIPLSQYPRPQWKRDSYLCLNGEWEYALSKKKEIPFKMDGKIIVPYPLESALSGVQKRLDKNWFLIYKKVFFIPSSFLKEKTILHFDAVDQKADVYLNGHYLGHHAGGYLPFSFEIQEWVKESNELVVIVEDNLSKDYGYGKQSEKSHGMWYTKISGIWKTVWIESVPQTYFKKGKMEVTLNSFTLCLDTDIEEKEIQIVLEDGQILHKRFKENQITIPIPSPHLWSPEDPFCYSFILKGGEDEISSYFALRTIETKQKQGHPYLCLNGHPYFFHGLLDQGYFSEGIFTPNSYDDYEREILLLKKMGWNTLRKHIKIEPDYFYYLCDKNGMIVFQDMVNHGKYSFFMDTVLPTLGKKKWKNRGKHRSSFLKENFISSMKETSSFLYNHPSILYYTIFNEGWGQFSADEMYELLKKEEPSRIIDATSGWFFAEKSDVESHHIYFKKVRLKSKKLPLILSEFGGYVYQDKEHSFRKDKKFGYRIYRKKEDFQKGLLSLYEKEIIPLISQGLCGAIYTQVSDVEEETNGLFTYDREVVKVKIEDMISLRTAIEKERKKIE